jgi:L-rhamnose mutarotase
MRICFHLRIRPELLEEYRALHDEIWPELRNALKSAGIRNYSLYLWKDGNEFGVLECDDWELVRTALASNETVSKWEELMANYLETPVDPLRGPNLLEEIFHLE